MDGTGSEVEVKVPASGFLEVTHISHLLGVAVEYATLVGRCSYDESSGKYRFEFSADRLYVRAVGTNSGNRRAQSSREQYG